MKTRAEWAEAAAKLETDVRPFVDGQYVTPAEAAKVEHICPATGEAQYTLAFADLATLDAAVAVARQRFDDGVWSRAHPTQRRDALLKLASLIDANQEALALCETLDTGKAIRDSYLRDVPGAAATLRWYAGAADKIYGETAPVGSAALATISLEPVGVVGAVIPWNFPIETAFWKVSPALALGNSVVLKPDEKSSRSALIVAALAIEAGIPAGVFNVVLGGAEIGAAMGLHPGIDALSFTGSTEVGRKFLEYAARSNLKLISLECGGKSANVVFADADLDRAAAAAAGGIFFNQGQVCSANSRLLVERTVLDEFVERVRVEAQAYSPGAPLDPETAVGAMIGIDHRNAVLAKINASLQEGGTLVTGGVTKAIDGWDNYIEPTIVTGVPPSAEIVREEVFGPVLCVLPFDNEQQAIQMANDSPYALAASVWTRSFARSSRAAAKLRAGTVSVNAVDALDTSLPFGGFKTSGFGRDLSLHAFRNYAQPKSVWYALQD